MYIYYTEKHKTEINSIVNLPVCYSEQHAELNNNLNNITINLLGIQNY